MSVSILFEAAKPSVPVIHQSEAAECGLACIAMVAGYYGHQTSLISLRRKFDTSLRGMTLNNVVSIADRLGFSSRALRVSLDEVKKVNLPAIIHWDLNHFVVLTACGNDTFHINDPALGKRILARSEFSNSFTGIALELHPAENFERQKDTERLKLTDLWGQTRGLKSGLIQLLVLSLFLQVVILISPLFLQAVVDEVLRKSNISLLVVLAIGFGGLAFINAATVILRNLLVIYLGSTISFQIASSLFKHLLALPLEYFEKRHMGDITARFQSVEPVRKLLTEGVIGAFIDGLMAITTLILMFVYSPILGAVSLCAWLLYLALRMIMFHINREREEAAISAGAKEKTLFMESVRGVASLKLFSGERMRHRLWQNLYASSINKSADVQKLRAWFDGISQGINGIELVILVYIAANLVLKADFTVGMIFAFLAYRTSFSTKASALIEQFVEFRMLGLHLERLADIVATQPEKVFPENEGIGSSLLSGCIEIKNISYRYSSDSPKVLSDISLKVEAGECVAIVGPTGCGKSTLLKIMTTLFHPEDGEIYIDGNPLVSVGMERYRKCIGVVSQEDSLMSGTLAENISFFDPDVTEKKLMQVAKDAYILDEILALPMQFESLVGDMGAALSGGQKQRLAIARALYRKPKILFMDEGTSHLDVGTEQKINQTISELGITRVIVAHRPETIRTADKVYQFIDGCLVLVTDCVEYGDAVVQLNTKSSATEEGYLPSSASEADSFESDTPLRHSVTKA